MSFDSAPQNFDRYQDLLPKTGIAMSGIRILSYLNEDGVICYKFRHAGDIAVTQVVGLLEMVKADILKVALEMGHGTTTDETDDTL